VFVLGIFGPLRLPAILGQRDTAHSLDPLSWKLAHFFLHKKSAKKIGLEYLRCVPREADTHLLTDLICSSQEERWAQLAHADGRMRRELLLHQQRQDFAHGRIVKVQGWILSETEVRLCALAALSE
jgi:hypothetical protein